MQYHEVGVGPPLVLLHGSDPGVTGWRDFRRVVTTFAEHFRCLIPDFPGFDPGDKVDTNPMLTAQHAFVEFVNALRLEQFDIIGNSMGSGVAIDYAMANPDRVHRLVVLGGGGPNIFSTSPSEAIRTLRQFGDNPTKGGLIQWMHTMVYDPMHITDELVNERWNGASRDRTVVGAQRTFSTAALTQLAQASAGAGTPPTWTVLHRLTVPTLLVWGRDDRVTPLDMALIPMRTIPHAELHVLPNCGHWVMLDQPDAFISASLAFLRRPSSECR